MSAQQDQLYIVFGSEAEANAFSEKAFAELQPAPSSRITTKWSNVFTHQDGRAIVRVSHKPIVTSQARAVRTSASDDNFYTAPFDPNDESQITVDAGTNMLELLKDKTRIITYYQALAAGFFDQPLLPDEIDDPD